MVAPTADGRDLQFFDTETEALSEAKEWSEHFPNDEVQLFKLLATVKSAPAVTYMEPKKEAPPIEKLREAAAKVPQAGEPVEQRHAVAVTSLPTTLPPPNVPGGRIRRMPA
jgi:hypothetical protein